MPTSPLDLQALQHQLEQYLLSTNWLDHPGALSILAHGETNLIFRMNSTALLRLAVSTPNQRFGGEIPRVTQFEREILLYLQGTGIGHTVQTAQLEPTPEFPYTFLITNYLPGGPLNYSRKHLKQCAETLAHLHRLPRQAGYDLDRLSAHVPVIQQPLNLFYQEAIAYAQPYLEASEADPEVVAMIQAVLEQARRGLTAEPVLEQYPHRCLVHSDHTCENWVVNDQQAHLIDWEWAEISSPAGDLGHFLSPVTVRRYQNYRLPAGDRQFFLQCYFDALEDADLAATIAQHFAAFGIYPAVRSLCWTAGYWITASRWYAQAADSPSAEERLARWRRSREQFPELWQDIMDGFQTGVE